MNYIQNSERMFADITDGIAVVIDSETGIYYGMNSFGSALFEQLINGASDSDIISAVKGINGCPADIDKKIKTFIDYILNEGIISETKDTNHKEVLLNDSVVSGDSFKPECIRYTDAQEMIFADPIHEVKDNQGWSPDKGSLNTNQADVDAKKAKMNK